jgi:hypothetical protein
MEEIMKRLIVALLLVAPIPGLAADGPPVKKSSTGICHAQGSSYYAQTKKFEAFKTMDDCLKSGGRLPKK